MHRQSADSDVFRAIADPTRRAILDRLRRGPSPVNGLAAEFAQSRPAISRHLRILRLAEIVAEDRVGRERVYRLNPERLQDVAAWIEGYAGLWRTSLNRLKTHLEKNP